MSDFSGQRQVFAICCQIHASQRQTSCGQRRNSDGHLHDLTGTQNRRSAHLDVSSNPSARQFRQPPPAADSAGCLQPACLEACVMVHAPPSNSCLPCQRASTRTRKSATPFQRLPSTPAQRAPGCLAHKMCRCAQRYCVHMCCVDNDCTNLPCRKVTLLMFVRLMSWLLAVCRC